MAIHCFKPVISTDCESIILGTMPSVESLNQHEYYANKNNHFWDFIFRIFEPRWNHSNYVNSSIEFERRYELLITNKIALWDVLFSCDREGSNDKKIENEVVNDFDIFFNKYKNLKKVYFNGGPAKKFFDKKYPKGHFNDLSFFQINSSSSLNPNNTFRVLNEWSNQLSNNSNL